MSAKVVRNDAGHDAWNYSGEDVDGSIDSGGVVSISEEKYSARDGSGVGATQVGGVGECV